MTWHHREANEVETAGAAQAETAGGLSRKRTLDIISTNGCLFHGKSFSPIDYRNGVRVPQ